jgi:hypothetical protein
MAQNTKGDIIEILSADFSTTTPVERIASQITVMDAMEPYFEFISMFVGCGIPEITLQGTPEDWQKVLEKTQRLADYDLKWWISELTPLLRQFVKASQGDVDKKFWSEMFKCHVMKSKRGSRMIYPPDVIDGWIVKFFPYDKDGNRNDLVSVNKRAITGHNLPDEIVKVDLKYIHAPQGTEPVTTMLELWAGFIGLEQDDTTFALTPRIGWFISRKDEANDKLRQRFEADNMRGGISLKVKEVPSALLELPHIKQLELRFIDSIVIPDKMKNVRIDKLSLHGKISEQEKDRIRAMFPETQLYIN